MTDSSGIVAVVAVAVAAVVGSSYCPERGLHVGILLIICCR